MKNHPQKEAGSALPEKTSTSSTSRAAAAAAAPSMDNTQSQKAVVSAPKPSLLNGAQYEQPLQLSSAAAATAPSISSPQESRASYLQDQFPSYDDMEEEEPLTLDDGLDDSTSGVNDLQRHVPMATASSPTQQDQSHPLVKQQNNCKPKLLSKLSIPQKASPSRPAKPGLSQASAAGLQEEMDSYPHPDDFSFVANASVARSASSPTTTPLPSLLFTPHYAVTRHLEYISQRIMRSPQQYDPTAAATWIGFWALFLVTCANYVLMPMRDAIALAVGVQHIPKLTLASTVMAIFSSVPIGWLFEAPDPERRAVWKKLGLTRGETQGSSLALFYRCFAFSLWSYAIGFMIMDFLVHARGETYHENIDAIEGTCDPGNVEDDTAGAGTCPMVGTTAKSSAMLKVMIQQVGQVMYIAFFLVVHLMKLHSLSLLWGVTTEAMEYEETARKRHLKRQQQPASYPGENKSDSYSGSSPPAPSSKTRLQRLAFVGFGGTVGGILGSVIASSLAQIMGLSGLLVVSALMLEAAAQLSIELGRIMHKHWMEQQLFPSVEDLASLDPSMKRSSSQGSMKRISSGNSLSRVKSMSELKSKHELQHGKGASSSLQSLEQRQQELDKQIHDHHQQQKKDDSFSQRFLRGIRTILQSRLLMAIFTYNALYASTTTLLSFQRAELVANRKKEITNESNTAFLANINMVSSVAVFALQASGLGAFVAHKCGSRWTLALMPIVRLLGVLTLAHWHHTSHGEPPNLLLFLILDECCRIMNMAVAKPVRESLWRGLSNEARYEAKPIVDTLANRWGGGSAAFLVSSIHRLLDLFGVPPAQNGDIRVVLGFPPVLFLCMVVSTWWAGVSADLGQIRQRIDLELKKMQ